MTRVTVVRSIAAPLDTVFRAVTDIGKLPDSNPDVVGIEFLGETRSGVGTRFRETRRMGSKEAVTELEITEFVENEHARFVADSHGTTWDTVFTVRSLAEGADPKTELRIAMDARAQKLLPKLLNPVFKGLFKKGMEKHIDAVLAYCEREAAGAP